MERVNEVLNGTESDVRTPTVSVFHRVGPKMALYCHWATMSGVQLTTPDAVEAKCTHG